MENEMGVIQSIYRNFRSAQNVLPLKEKTFMEIICSN